MSVFEDKYYAVHSAISKYLNSVLISTAIAAFATLTPAVQAQTSVTLQPIGRGWVCDQVHYPCAVYGQPGVVQAANGSGPANNVYAGSGLTPNDQGQDFNAGLYRNWFAFSIPKLTGTLASATLTLPEPNRWNVQDLTYTIYGLNAQPKAFADVRGVAYGSVITHATDFGKITYLKFNALGLAAIEGSQGKTLYIGGIDSGENLLGYHGDFSGTGASDSPPNPNTDRTTPLVLSVGSSTPAASVDATCPAPPAGLNSFVIEHFLDLTKIQSTLTSNAPAGFAPVFTGAKEVRDRISYDNVTRVMKNEAYLVDPGAPFPTPPTFDILANRLVYLIVPIDKITFSCRPRPVVTLTGTAVDGYPIFGPPAGAPVTFSFGYTMDTPIKIRDIVNLVAGVALTYEPTAYSTVTFSTVGAVISGAPVLETNSPTVTLDGSTSTGKPLSYSWTTSAYGAAIIDPTSDKTPVYLDIGYGDYTVQLKVRNEALGEESTSSVIIRYKPAQ